MKYCAWLLCCTCISFNLFSQPGAAAGNGDNRLQAIKRLIKEAEKSLTYSRYDEAQNKYDHILEESNALNYRPGILAWYDGRIAILCQKREITKTLPLAHAFQQWAEKQNDEGELAYAAYQYALIYRMKMNFDSSFYFLEKTLQHLAHKKDPALEAKVYSGMLMNYTRMEMPDNALTYGKKAMALYRGLNDTPGIAKIHIFMGSAYNLLEEDSSWHAYTLEGLRLAKAIQNPLMQIIGYNNLALYHKIAGEPDSVLLCFREAYHIAETTNLPGDKNDIAINIAREYNVVKEYEKSLQLLNQVYADTALRPLAPQKLHLSQLAHYEALKGLGRYKEATEVIDRYTTLSARLYQEESRQKALETDERLKKSEQEKQLAAKKWQIKKQNLWLLALGLSLTAAALLILFLRKKQQAGRQQIANLQKEKELEKIRALLDGQLKERTRVAKEIHDDLGSSLTSIGLHTELLQRQPEFRDNPYIQKISASTRDMIARMNEIIWAVNTNNDSLNSLLAHIRKFASEFLQPAGIAFVYNDEGVQQDHPLGNMARRNIYLTVKEALHNVVKHSGAKNVHIDIDVKENNLAVVIADDGKGFSPENTGGNGQGLQNMKMRTKEIGGTWQLIPGKGTKLMLTYPLSATNGETSLS